MSRPNRERGRVVAGKLNLAVSALRWGEEIQATVQVSLPAGHRAEVTDIYPGGRIVYSSDPGEAQIFVRIVRAADADARRLGGIAANPPLPLPSGSRRDRRVRGQDLRRPHPDPPLPSGQRHSAPRRPIRSRSASPPACRPRRGSASASRSPAGSPRVEAGQAEQPPGRDNRLAAPPRLGHKARVSRLQPLPRLEGDQLARLASARPCRAVGLGGDRARPMCSPRACFGCCSPASIRPRSSA